VSIDSAEVRRIAALAQLDLDEDNVELFRIQLGTVLDHVASLGELDVRGVPPTSHSRDACQPLREDTEGPCLSPDEATRNAPDPAHGWFRVPWVLARVQRDPDDDA
jgi:aspartyl-tRNA(Asn)/glutamyl-tRNA(Gln) amidotransferase subunit C